MEPIVDSSNKKKVPLVVWDENSFSLGDLQQHYDANGENQVEKPSGDSEVRIALNLSNGRGVDRHVEDSFSTGSAEEFSLKKKSKVPDGGWGWVVVGCSFIISMIADGISFSFGLLYIEFLNYFHESKSKTSWIGSLFMAVPLLLGPVMSALVDRYGCRSMTILGGLISGLGFVIATFGKTIEWEFMFFGVLAGIGLGLCYVTAVVSIAYWFDKYRTFAIGLGSCGTGVGTFVYAPFTQFLIERYGWRGTILVLAGTLFNLCVCGTLMRDPAWLIEEQKSSKDSSSSSSSSSFACSINVRGAMDEEIRLLQSNFKSAKSLGNQPSNSAESSRKVSHQEADSDESLGSVKSVFNLPTFLKQENVPPEVFEQLSTNKAVFNVILENYPSLLECKSLSDQRISNMFLERRKKSSPIRPIPKVVIAKDATLKEEEEEEDKNREKLPDEDQSGNDVVQRRENVQNQSWNKNFVAKCMPASRDTGQHYLKNIRLHRNSVMYRGAMLNIPRYRLRASSCPNIFRNSMTTIAKENEEKWYADALELFQTMFDFSMFVELHFLLMSLATIILFIWLIVPYFYLAEHVTRHGYTEVEASFLLSIIGVANCLGMIGLGWAGDQPWMNVTKTYAACLTLCGLTCIFMPLTIDSYNVLAALSALFGLFFASNYSFTPSLVVQLIPLERFTTAYGLILLCQGIGCLVGPPLAGWIFDLTGELDLSFYLAGGWIIFSAVLTLLIQYTENRKVWGSGKLEMEKAVNSQA